MRRLRSQRGAELIEFALVLPLLLMIVLGIVDFGFLFQRLEVVTNAAREGARMAVLPGYSTADVQNRVLAYIQTGGLPTTGAYSPPSINVTNVSIGYDPADPTKVVDAKQVSVVYTHNYMFIGGIAGWFGGSFSTVPLRAVATMRKEPGT